jgi:hypothetical protein
MFPPRISGSDGDHARTWIRVQGWPRRAFHGWKNSELFGAVRDSVMSPTGKELPSHRRVAGISQSSAPNPRGLLVSRRRSRPQVTGHLLTMSTIQEWPAARDRRRCGGTWAGLRPVEFPCMLAIMGKALHWGGGKVGQHELDKLPGRSCDRREAVGDLAEDILGNPISHFPEILRRFSIGRLEATFGSSPQETTDRHSIVRLRSQRPTRETARQVQARHRRSIRHFDTLAQLSLGHSPRGREMWQRRQLTSL